MNIKFVYLTIALATLALKLNGQVTISPEIGISYMPISLGYGICEDKYHNFEFIFGLSGSVPISKKMYLQTKATFAIRQNDYSQQKICPLEEDYRGYKYDKTNEIDASLNGYYKLSNNNSVGLGLGLLYDFNSVLIDDWTNYEIRQPISNHYIPTVNISYEYTFGSTLFRISYMRMLKNNFTRLRINRIVRDYNDFRFTIGYIFGKRKEKNIYREVGN